MRNYYILNQHFDVGEEYPGSRVGNGMRGFPLPTGDHLTAGNRKALLVVDNLISLHLLPSVVPMTRVLGHVHTCSGREPDSSVPGARVRFASTRGKN